jgi:N6-adenosine-specific RNA methylase IME4
MTIDEIKGIKIPSGPECHLFLWTTQRFLRDSFDIMESWGFSFIFNMVWHKNGGFQPFNLPQYNCEFCMYGRKGTPHFSTTKDFFTCFSAKRGKHSEKPEEFYDIIRRVTYGKRIDMFNRREITGFDVWGNQA